MTITLTHPTAGAGGTPLALDLPPDLIWTDEFAWSSIVEAEEYSGTGALLTDEWQKQAGRPITLTGEVTHGWCERAELKTLHAWSNQTGLVMALNWNGQAYTVKWRRVGKDPIVAEPVIPYADPIDTDPYSLVLSFTEL